MRKLTFAGDKQNLDPWRRASRSNSSYRAERMTLNPASHPSCDSRKIETGASLVPYLQGLHTTPSLRYAIETQATEEPHTVRCEIYCTTNRVKLRSSFKYDVAVAILDQAKGFITSVCCSLHGLRRRGFLLGGQVSALGMPVRPPVRPWVARL